MRFLLPRCSQRLQNGAPHPVSPGPTRFLVLLPTPCGGGTPPLQPPSCPHWSLQPPFNWKPAENPAATAQTFVGPLTGSSLESELLTIMSSG